MIKPLKRSWGTRHFNRLMNDSVEKVGKLWDFLANWKGTSRNIALPASELWSAIIHESLLAAFCAMIQVIRGVSEATSLRRRGYKGSSAFRLWAVSQSWEGTALGICFAFWSLRQKSQSTRDKGTAPAVQTSYTIQRVPFSVFSTSQVSLSSYTHTILTIPGKPQPGYEYWTEIIKGRSGCQSTLQYG